MEYNIIGLGPTLPPASIISMTWNQKTKQLFIILLKAHKSYIARDILYKNRDEIYIMASFN
jgi:hypothetical protein